MTLNMNNTISQKDKERIMQSPEFVTELMKACEIMSVDKSVPIPDYITNYTRRAISNTPFAETGLDFATYHDLHGKPATDWGVALLQKATTLIMSAKPSLLGIKMCDNTHGVLKYLDVIESCTKIHDHITKLFSEAKEATVTKLYNREKLSAKI